MDMRNCYDDDGYAAAYARLEFPGTYYLAFRDLPQLFDRHVRGRRALDFGCGTGRSTRFLIAQGFAATGVDIAAEMVRRAWAIDPAGDYRLVADGDLLKLDFGAIWDGFHADSAVTVIVGEPASAEAEKLVRVTEEALEAGISQIRPGGRLSDIGAAVEQVAAGAGFGVVREYVGHGIGRALHEDPQVPNYGKAGRGPELKPGLVLAVERVQGKHRETMRALAEAIERRGCVGVGKSAREVPLGERGVRGVEVGAEHAALVAAA